MPACMEQAQIATCFRMHVGDDAERYAGDDAARYGAGAGAAHPLAPPLLRCCCRFLGAQAFNPAAMPMAQDLQCQQEPGAWVQAVVRVNTPYAFGVRGLGGVLVGVDWVVAGGACMHDAGQGMHGCTPACLGADWAHWQT